MREDVGRWVRVIGVPAGIADLPAASKRVFRHCLGKTFRVTEVAPHGWLGLDVASDVDKRFGGVMNEIWIEPALVEEDEPRLNRASGRPAVGDAMHLVHGVTGSLEAPRSAILTVMDSLTYGPVAEHPKTHGQLRRDFWRSFHRNLPSPPSQRRQRFNFGRDIVSAMELAQRLRHRRGRPLVVWVGGSWSERLFLWWSCDALVRSRTALSNIWIATAGKPHEPRLSVFSAADLVRFFAAAKPLPRVSIAAGARMWGEYTRRSPRGLAATLVRRPPVWPMGPISDDYLRLIPIVRRGRFFLSGFDQTLLGCLRVDTWRTTVDFIKDKATSDAYVSMMDAYGDLLIVSRLGEWARHAPNFVEQQQCEGKSSFNCVQYRLTEAGRRMLVRGLDDLALAPPIDVGGFCAYGSGSTWAVQRTSAGSRLVQVRAPA